MIGYVTIEQAKEIISKRYDLDKTDEELTRALYRALDLIESIDVRNSGKSPEQSLTFPRLCENEVPENIKVAQCLEAYSIATTSESVDKDITEGITSRHIGDMSISYGSRGTSKIDKFKNDVARGIISKYQRKSYGWN